MAEAAAPDPAGADVPARGGERAVPERRHTRPDGVVDADRLIYSDAFRRLTGVTQVVSPSDEVVHHDRLTHSLKVGQVARRMAVHLRHELDAPVDPDVVYAAALAHDLGHPPFGHAGERELQAILDGDIVTRAGEPAVRDHDPVVLDDSFEGNAQTFRVLTRLSLRREGQEAGLNWTFRSLAAVTKYPWLRGGHSRPSLALKWGAYASEAGLLDRVIEETRALGLWTGERSLEADVMDWSDDIAYAVHDIEDFYRAASIPLGQLRNDDGEWEDYLAFVATEVAYKNWDDRELERVGALVRRHLPTQPFRGSERNRFEIRDFAVAMTRLLTRDLAVGDDGLRAPRTNRIAAELLKRLVRHYVIRRPDVAMMQRGQRRALRELVFDLDAMLAEQAPHLADPTVPLPPRLVSYARRCLQAQEMAHLEEAQRRRRAVVDFVCSLTDRQALLLGQRLSGDVAGGVGHDWLTV